MYSKEKYQQRISAGLCGVCGKPAIIGKTKCAACAERNKKYSRQKYNRMTKEEKAEKYKKDRGYRLKCIENPEYKETVKNKWREYYREYYRKRKTAGLCVQCGEPAVDGKIKCAACARWDSIKQKARRERMTPEEKKAAYKKQRECTLKKITEDPEYKKRYREQKRKSDKKYYEKWYKGGWLNELNED